MDTDDFAVVQLQTLYTILTYVVIALPFAIGNGYLASLLGRNVPVWVILTLIPIVNYVFLVYVGYVVLYRILGYLKDLSGRSPPAR